jgi:hypothetical protein
LTKPTTIRLLLLFLIEKVKYYSIIYSSLNSIGLYGRAFLADSGNGLKTNPVPSTIAAGLS